MNRNVAVSTIAWDNAENDEVRARLIKHGVAGIEIAPNKLGPNPTQVSNDEISRYRDYWEEAGLVIPSMQALLFNAPFMSVFGDGSEQRALVRYLSAIIHVGGRLGVQRFVFGSPKNRLKGSRTFEEAIDVVVPIFRQLGDRAAGVGAVFCIEPNPIYYGCDFVTNAREGETLVSTVNHEGFGLHLDAAGMQLSGDAPTALTNHTFCHFHISEKNLLPIGAGDTDHAAFGAALASSDYAGWISIEMRRHDPVIDNLDRALETVRRNYLVRSGTAD